MKQHIDAERVVRELLERNGLPQPDEVEYGFTCVRLFWKDTQTVLVIDLDDDDDEDDSEGSRAA
jgi:hypothetical protein